MKIHSYNRRKVMFLCIVIISASLFLVIRLGYLMIYKSDYYDTLATALHERERSIKAPRGKIYDRNGNILADNEAVCSISVIHSQIEDQEQVIDVLCSYLDKDEAEIRKKVEKVSSRESIATNIDKNTADTIREMNIPGIKVDEDYKRYYPYGSLASKVLGFTGSDNQGIVGIEVTYDDILSGISGSINTVTDAKGIEIDNAAETRVEPVSGNNLVLSLDLNIQKYATQAALKVMEEKQANRVDIIIMNPSNGEIYAMVDVPEYDLNSPYELNITSEDASDLDDDSKMDLLNNMWRNFNISDTYEPGSTFKIVTSTAALEEQVVSLADTFYCPGYKIVEDRKIRCHKTTGHGSEDFLHALMNSCNPAFMEIGERVGAENMYKYYNKLGLFAKTGIDLPGEAGSIMHKLEDIGPVELATMSFGQSFQISPIQFITAAATVVNGGNKITPHLGIAITDTDNNIIEELEYPVENGTISCETSETMKSMLESVVAEGTGSKAIVDGYRIGGKTATSEKLPRGTGLYIASFIGFAPADNPQVMALILIDEPKGTYYGGTIAAPVIQDIFSNILPYLGIEKE
jgi:stage V sporulation protein D (sporulation-specific penicillin-binding protein)